MHSDCKLSLKKTKPALAAPTSNSRRSRQVCNQGSAKKQHFQQSLPLDPHPQTSVIVIAQSQHWAGRFEIQINDWGLPIALTQSEALDLASLIKGSEATEAAAIHRITERYIDRRVGGAA